jgi:hypothetical protein
MINFNDDLKCYVQKEFKYFGIDYGPVETTKDLINLFTLHEKVIFPVSREVVYAEKLRAQLIDNPRGASVVEHLRSLFTKGKDVNPHQSKEVLNHHTPDDLVFDWKIYHLHLSTTKTKHKYFVDRTKELLFAYVDRKRTIFLGIFEHNPPTHFSTIELLEILDKTDSDILTEANGVVGISHELSDEERLALRKGKVNEGIVKVNDKFVFPPNLGKVTSGNSLASVKQATDLLNWVNRNTARINKDVARASADFKARFGIEKDISFALEFTPCGPVIIDRNSGQVLIPWLEMYADSGHGP